MVLIDNINNLLLLEMVKGTNLFGSQSDAVNLVPWRQFGLWDLDVSTPVLKPLSKIFIACYSGEK